MANTANPIPRFEFQDCAEDLEAMARERQEREAALEAPQRRSMSTRKVLEVTALEQDFASFNVVRNQYNLREEAGPAVPCRLLQAAESEFVDFCKVHYIQADKYPFLRVTQCDGVTWQVDFHTDEDTCGPHVSIYDIFFNEERGEILQFCAGI